MKVIVEKANSNLIKNMNKEIKKIASKTEIIIVVGEKEKDNISKIYELSLKEVGNAMIVQTMDDLYLNYIRRFKTVGVIQDPAMPQNQIDTIIDVLENTQVEGYIYEHFK